jgi:carboxyl-terminal processing protease
MKKLLILFSLIALISGSCKKDIPPEDTYTIDEQARDNLYDFMNEIYLWYKEMPVVVKENFSDPYELLNAMRYLPVDRWSYLQTYDEYIDQSTGSFVGHGIRLGLDPTSKVRIVQIYNNSSLYSKGVRRGWIIKKINGTDLAPILIARDWEAYDQLLGPPEAGVTNTFLFEIPDGRDSTITSTKSSFILNTVLLYDTLHLKSGIAGHLVYDQFIPPSNQEFETAFAFFKQNNITDLIVDLRYNGGGDLNVLVNLASYIAGDSKINLPYLKLTCNDKNTAYNETFSFKSVASALNLTKLITICTRYTTSASEDLINGLKPYLDVICIGDTTNGKPVGMFGKQFKTYYMFWPIAFSIVNSADQGEFYDGFAPEKYVPDDITHDWSDRNELCLKEAIYYLENGAVSPKGIYSYQPSVQISEKPERISNAYILEK